MWQSQSHDLTNTETTMCCLIYWGWGWMVRCRFVDGTSGMASDWRRLLFKKTWETVKQAQPLVTRSLPFCPGRFSFLSWLIQTHSHQLLAWRINIYIYIKHRVLIHVIRSKWEFLILLRNHFIMATYEAAHALEAVTHCMCSHIVVMLQWFFHIRVWCLFSFVKHLQVAEEE